MSGYSKSRFVDLSDTDFDELECGICLGVFRDPIETNCCRKTFCTKCIEDWIKRNNTCPNDRKPLYRNDLIGSSKIVLNLLAKLQIKCEFSDIGCPKVVSLESLAKHMDECNYNKCKNCGERIGDLIDHNCEQTLRKTLNELRSNNHFLNQRINMLNSKTTKLESTLRKHNIIVCYKCLEMGHKAPQCSVGNARNKKIKQPLIQLNTNEKTNECLSDNKNVKREQQNNVFGHKIGENSRTQAINANPFDDSDYVIIEQKSFECKFCHRNIKHTEIHAHMETMHKQRLCPICSKLFDLTIPGVEIYLQMHVEHHFDHENQAKQYQKPNSTQTREPIIEINENSIGFVGQIFKKLFN